MSLVELLQATKSKGIKLYLNDGQLAFKGPSGAMTDELKAQIVALKPQITELLQNANTQITVTERNPGDTAIPSYAQQRMWLLDSLEGGSANYNVPSSFRLLGELDLNALQQAFSSIVYRHQSLRTCFKEDNSGRLCQVIQDDYGFNVEIDDLSALNPIQQERDIQHYVSEQANKLFNLSCDFMLRVKVLKLADTEHVVMITMHHIASDGWSLGILINEFCSLYSAFVTGQSDPLEPLPLQYADYAQWQRDQLKGENLDKQLGYWQQQLVDLPMVHNLPTDKPRPQVQTYNGNSYDHWLTPELSAKLNSFCKENGATLFMGLHAALAVLLARYSNETDIVMGSPVANREQEGIGALIGFFVNTLVLRSDLSGSPSFKEMLKQSQNMLLDAYAHQQVPFEQVVEKLQPQRSLSHSPLFQVLLVLQNNEEGVLSLPNLSLQPIKGQESPAKFDLSLNIDETKQGLKIGWAYNKDLFDAATIEKMASHFASLVAQMLSQPDASVFDLNLLSSRECQQELIPSTFRTHFDNNHCIHELFEQQVLKTPHATALVFDSEGNRQVLSYRALNEKANQLAHYLVSEKGVVPDSFVGISVERSVDMIVAILAVLKAGGAYIPLDPSHPESRLKYIVEDAGVTTILTQSHLCGHAAFTHLDTVSIDEHAFLTHLTAFSYDNIPVAQLSLTTTNLAYVIYTSGSTGQPKGVLIEHQNVNRLLDATEFGFSFSESDVWTMFHSFAFDFSVWEMWGALANGAKLIVVPHDVARSTTDFHQLLLKEKVTVLNQTPTAFAHLVNVAINSEDALSLRYVVFGGEALNLQSLSAWTDKFGDESPQLINMYGITETTVHASYKRIVHADIHAKDEASIIGVPLADLDIVLLNSHQNLVPRGVVGEMYIGGAGVSRGYLNRAELTEERFIENPYYDENYAHSSKRLYRSGDLARRMPDGELEYIGRVDHQVKIRGYRIELGEIESALLALSDVDDAVVVAKDAEEGRFLIAYVATRALEVEQVSDGEAQQRYEYIDTVRQALGNSLPDYMVPQYYVLMDKLPLTGNGKVDTKALPELDKTKVHGKYVAPVTTTQKILCDVLQSVLNVEQVGVQDNFFELGGHSLLVMKVVSQAESAGLSLAPKQLFAAPVLADLAQLIDESTDSDTVRYVAPENRIAASCKEITPDLLPLIDLNQEEIDLIVDQVPGGVSNIQDIYPLAPLQQGVLFHHMMSEGSDPYVLQVVFTIESELALERFIRALQFVVNRHDVLRSAILWEDLNQPVQVVYREAELPVTRLQLDPEKDALAQVEKISAEQAPWIALNKGPLVQLKVGHTPVSEKHVVLLQYHHIIGDHSDMEIITHEIAEYEAGRGDELATPARYRDFVGYVLQQAKEHDPEAFFTQMLQDVDEPTLPFNLMNVRGDGSDISEKVEYVPTQEGARIRAAAKALKVSPAVLFHAAWAIVVGACSGRDDVVFGTVFSGSVFGGSQVQSTLGMFINTSPLRVKLSGINATELVQRVKTGLQQLLPFEQASLALAQNCSGVVGSAPLFSAILNYRHCEVGSDETEGSQHNNEVSLVQAKERTNYPFNLSVDDLGNDFELKVQIDTSVDPSRVMGYVQSALVALTDALLDKSTAPLEQLSILPQSEYDRLMYSFNDTAGAYPSHRCINQLFEEQAEISPDAIALIFEQQQLTYGELNQQAEQLASYLIAEYKIEHGALVGICLERSVEMMVGLLAILKIGAAYVPLDPGYPANRLRYIMDDSQIKYLLSHSDITPILAIKEQVSTICLDKLECLEGRDLSLLAQRKELTDSTSLAYMIYTSGSTGNPKGVMVSHKNVVNFFAGLDQKFGASDEVQTWLAVTSISFDISVLELFWTLSRGNKLVIQPDRPIPISTHSKAMEFSLFYFAAEEAKTNSNKYELLLEGAKIADANDFSAVWVPERHFASFGDQYPNPSVAAAAAAVVTSKLAIRAGSVVLPLHDPIRVAEEWSMVDNLSNGRVELAVASGWHPNDFVLQPEIFQQRHQVLRDNLASLHTLWEGKPLQRENGVGKLIDIRLHPAPIQNKLPIWITAAGSPETFRYAGSIGANLLTHLLGQSVEELAEKIAIYRQARADAGYEPHAGKVALMLHAFVSDAANIKEIVRGPLTNYLRESIHLVKPLVEEAGIDWEKDPETLLEFAFERYYHTSGLFGTAKTCLAKVEQLQEAGVDEIASLIDFGIDNSTTLANLPHMAELAKLCKQKAAREKMLAKRVERQWSPLELISKYKVTHMQCTPTYVADWASNEEGRQALKQLQMLCVGGEALLPKLADELSNHVGGNVYNMYGPTETTIWSSIEQISGSSVFIGPPILNTTFYVLNTHNQLVPTTVPGELCIGGAGVTQGYFNRKSLSKEKFITNPYNNNEVIYKTGDLVRWTENHTLQFLGRLDDQIKMNGFRIELGEIEHQIASCDGVHSALLMARKSEVGDQVLIAYVKPEVARTAYDEYNAIIENLKLHLSNNLPEYMMPSAFVYVEQWPLTPNGKINRRALPEVDSESLGQVHVEPETKTEQQLAVIWAKLLGLEVEKVGALGNFFNLGGHSLMAIRLVTEICQHFDVEVVLKMVFESPELRDMASAIDRVLLVKETDNVCEENVLAQGWL